MEPLWNIFVQQYHQQQHQQDLSQRSSSLLLILSLRSIHHHHHHYHHHHHHHSPALLGFPFAASGRAMTLQETDGFVKIISDADTDEVLGVHMVGPEVTELIAEAALAIEMGATVEDISRTIHAHPTLPESMMEAAEAVHGTAVHIFQKPKKK